MSSKWNLTSDPFANKFELARDVSTAVRKSRIPDINALIREKAVVSVSNRIEDIMEVAQKAAEEQIDKYFWYISRYVFGRKTKPVEFTDVEWEPLSLSYLVYSAKKRNDVFWVSGSSGTNSLQTFFRSIKNGSWYFDKTDIFLKKSYGRDRNGKWVFEFGIKSGINKLAGNPNMEFDRLGVPIIGEQMVKIYGKRNEERRPFFHPVARIFLEKLIPAHVVSALARNGYDLKRIGK